MKLETEAAETCQGQVGAIALASADVDDGGAMDLMLRCFLKELQGGAWTGSCADILRCHMPSMWKPVLGVMLVLEDELWSPSFRDADAEERSLENIFLAWAPAA